MLIGRHDIEKLLRLDPASTCLSNPSSQSNLENNASDAETVEIELELSNLLLNLPSIKQVWILYARYCNQVHLGSSFEF